MSLAISRRNLCLCIIQCHPPDVLSVMHFYLVCAHVT